MMSRESPPREGDPLMVLCDLRRRKDALNALDLSGTIKEAAAKLRVSREEQLREVVKLRAINTTSEVQLTSSLQHIRGRIKAQRDCIWRRFVRQVLWAKLRCIQSKRTSATIVLSLRF